MQVNTPSGFILSQSDAFTVNLCKNRTPNMEIFGVAHPLSFGICL